MRLPKQVAKRHAKVSIHSVTYSATAVMYIPLLQDNREITSPYWESVNCLTFVTRKIIPISGTSSKLTATFGQPLQSSKFSERFGHVHKHIGRNQVLVLCDIWALFLNMSQMSQHTSLKEGQKVPVLNPNSSIFLSAVSFKILSNQTKLTPKPYNHF